MPQGVPVTKVAVAPPLEAFTAPRQPVAPAAPPAAVPAGGAEGIPKLLTEVEVYLKYGLAEKAIGHLRAILAIDPETPVALEKLRDLHMAAGRRAEALEAAEQAIRAAMARGEGDRARDSLAWLRHHDPNSPNLPELASAMGTTEEVQLSSGEVEEEVLEPGDLPATLAELELADELPAVMDDDSLAELAAGPANEEVIDEEPMAPPAPVATRPAIVPPAPPARARPGQPPPRAPAPPPAPELELEGPDAALLRAAMASIDSEEVLAEPGLESLPELGEEPVEETSAPVVMRPPPPPPPRAVPPPRAAPAPAARAVPAVPDLTDELEEADFFAQQGLLSDSHDALLVLKKRHPGHPAVEARLAEVERKLAAKAAPPSPAPVTSPGAAAAAADLRATRQTPNLIEPGAAGGASFDLGADLAEVLDQAPDLGGGDDEFQYSVEDVFNQFKRGVAETVTPEDSDTHYDLGIAYREMGLVEDAINEFETALRGNNRKKEIDCLSMIATCRLGQDRPADAIEPLRRALRSDYLTKESAKALHYELALALEALEEGEQALWCYQRVARTDPTYRDAAGRIAALGGGPGRPPAGMGATTETRAVVGPGRTGAIPVTAPRTTPRTAASAPPPGPPGPKKNIGFL